MLHGVFDAKGKKISVAVFVLLAVIIGFAAIGKIKENRQYEQQTVMAEQFLEAGDYEQAVEAYQKAMAMKLSDGERLSIGLAEAYIGVNEYDLALEVLRNCYEKTSGVQIKEKIEEVTVRKSDYEYQQIISRGDIYFSNEEYDKAISEYEKAKLIKSKEITSYQKIAESYIKKGNYELAKEEVEEGLTITQSDALNHTLEIVESYLLKQQYETMITKAEEFIYQENYKDGIAKYQEAINLLPNEDSAYIGLAEVFIMQKEYRLAVILLEDAKGKAYSEELLHMLEKALSLKEANEKRVQILSELYNAVANADILKISEIVSSDYFINDISANTPLYYSQSGEGDIVKGYGMIVYDEQSLYSGEISNNMKNGNGVLLKRMEGSGEQGYYYYKGEWKNDVPNGTGKTVDVETKYNENGDAYISKIITEGSFYNGTENGFMIKRFYVNEEEAGTVSYYTRKGVPEPATDENGQQLPPKDGMYPIGRLTLNGEPTEDYYYIKPGTFWSVRQ
ncbi:MAG: tetratricopeptide repeat protein [Clostridiales bacterium]|nr:tetratricopeptide repeat protein [Clostridiales bacterium]